MNRVKKFFSGQQGFANDFTYDFALRRLCVVKEDSWRGIYPSTFSTDFNPEPPLFAAKFANCDGYRHILAIANEDGKVALQDTTQRNDEIEERALNAPQCHYNAVFDVEWAPGEMKFVSASGDHTSRLWGVEGTDIRSIRPFLGHSRSVKCAAFRRDDPTVFATGGRDGAIIIWDTRASLNVDLLTPADNCIYSGHMGSPGTPSGRQRRCRTPKMMPATTSSSITGLAFQDTNTLISCGAGDGIIKVWDLRRNYTTYKREPLPKHSLPYAGTSTFKGFTNLIVDSSGSRLYANCMDNTIYCYNLYSYAPKPLACYKGLLNSTFYIKSCLSPDGKYLLSGSSDEKAYIWNLDYADEPLVALCGHTVEVTCVAWGATNDRPLVTCSDDARHKIWRIGPEFISNTDRTEFYRGHAEYVRQFRVHEPVSATTHKYNLRELESTPRSLRRLVEHNERTPGSAETCGTGKRSFVDLLGDATQAAGAGDHEFICKRPKIFEPRGRRLFSPGSSGSTSPQSTRSIHVHLSPVPESCITEIRLNCSATPSSPLSRKQTPSCGPNQENNVDALHSPVVTHVLPLKQPGCSSPLSERVLPENEHNMFNSPPNTAAGTGHVFHGPPAMPSSGSSVSIAATASTSFFSPTSNLPNYVLNGEAPHLSLMSPQRKAKEKVDWLTKIRKQKLMSSSRNGTTLTEKLNAEETNPANDTNRCVVGVGSPRLQSLRDDDNLRLTPRRRVSHSDGHAPRTPTSSRRNSETTILRFFSVQTLSKTPTVQNPGHVE